MFETSVIQARAIDNRKSRFSLLTMSLVFHSAVIVGAIVFSVATVDFPLTAPDEFAQAPVFMPVTVPPPLGRPDGGGKPQVTPPKQPDKQPVAPSTEQTAPPVIPENVTESTSTPTGTEGEGSNDGKVPGPIGVEWGTQDSPGPLDGPPAMPATPQPENKVYTVAEVKAPVIISRVEPLYPSVLVKTRMNGTVVVRCIIDKNGRIRDAHVVAATMPPFGDSVLRALKDWRYQPASLHGQAVECYLDLKVDFGVR